MQQKGRRTDEHKAVHAVILPMTVSQSNGGAKRVTHKDLGLWMKASLQKIQGSTRIILLTDTVVVASLAEAHPSKNNDHR